MKRSHKVKKYTNQIVWLKVAALLLIMGLALSYSLGPVQAQEDKIVQEIRDYLKHDDTLLFLLPNLHAGDRIYVYMEGDSGNLDPFIAITDDQLDLQNLRETFLDELKRDIAEGQDPFEALPDISNSLFLAWDDDSGEGYDSALSFEVPADGDYKLLATNAPVFTTFGDFRLLIGLNAPEVLTGSATPNTDMLAIYDRETSRPGVSVQEITGSLVDGKTATLYFLEPMESEDTLYVFIEATSGDLIPIIFLEDFGGKTLRSGNAFQRGSSGSLTFTFDERVRNYSLIVESCCEGEQTTEGDYRILASLNDPAVLEGDADEMGEPFIKEPFVVKIGVRLDQITDVDQKAENFSAVANIRYEWTDPDLAFNPDTCHCQFKTFTSNDFSKYVSDLDLISPEFTLFNQQGNRWTQNDNVVLFPDGRAVYFERFSTTFQAPDFNFKHFPFDTQDFYIRVRSLVPEELYVYTDLPEHTGLGDQLGEEEWLFESYDTEISTAERKSQFNFHFSGKRKLTFYITRIFIPLILIIIVAWITFFLKDYGKRVDITAGNLLLFIAFNFTISDSLPKLGYLTFLDLIIMATFLISVLVVVFNVVLKRLETMGKQDLAKNIDGIGIWLYPLVYVVAFIFLWIYSF
jgi:hypothetical protein